MEQYLAVLSLIFLVAAIVLGFFRKINMGVIAIAFALILGRLGGVKDGAIIGTFGTQLFIRLLGVMMLFSIAQTNGAIEKLTRKLAGLSSGTVRLIPVIIFVLFWVISAVGAGGPPALALAALITVPIAHQLNMNPLKLAPAAWWGGMGGLTTLNIVGILAKSLGADIGVDVNITTMMITTTVGMLILFIPWYFLCGWHKVKSDKAIEQEKTEPFTSGQIITLLGIVLLVVMSLFLKVDIGLAGFACAFILFLIPGVVEEKKAIAGIPWNTLIMIGGMGMLISMAQMLGGIDLLSNSLASIMTVRTAPALMSAMGSILSTVSSTTGVVMPTLIPTIPGIIESLGGGDIQELLYAVTIGASQTAISPLSTGGALMMAAYANIYKPSTEERSKVFVQNILYAVACAVIFAILALFGFYHWFL